MIHIETTHLIWKGNGLKCVKRLIFSDIFLSFHENQCIGNAFGIIGSQKSILANNFQTLHAKSNLCENLF